MNYELAKQLKDIGFSQNFSGEGDDILFPNDKEYDRYYNSEGESWEFAYEPTLSELIEACGNGFDALVKWHNPPTIAKEFKWCAYIKDHRFDGETPEIAIAKLWLALNKSK